MGCLIWFLIIVVLLTFQPVTAVQAFGEVDEITVNVTTDKGLAAAYPKADAGDAVHTIAEQLFMGSPVERVSDGQAKYENIIQQVFDKILLDIV